MPKSPPKWPRKFLRLICSHQFIDELEGDLFELFYRNLEEHGLAKARRKFVIDTLLSFRWYRFPGVPQFPVPMMWKNHFRLTYRYALRNRVYAIANLAGLCLGIAAFCFIFLYLRHETSYDTFHSHKDELFRIIKTFPESGQKGHTVSSQHSVAFYTEFPGIPFCRFGNDPVKIGDSHPIMVESFFWSDSSVFEMFSFPLLYGDPSTALDKPNSLALSESLATQLFGKIDPVGKDVLVKVYDSNVDIRMEITAVFKDIPENSHLQFSALGSMDNAEKMYASLVGNWSFNWLSTYVQIPSERQYEVQQFTPQLIGKYRGKEFEGKMGMELQAFSSVYLHSKDIVGNVRKGDIQTLYIFAAIGFLILLISAFNYINLSTAQSIQRAKEVGIRRVIGSQSHSIFFQFITESLVYTFLAGLVALFLVFQIVPILNTLLGLRLDLGSLGWKEGGIFLGGIMGLGLSAGLIPAMKMSGFTWRSTTSPTLPSEGKGLLRKSLIGIQYTITLVLLSATLVVYLQYTYMNAYDLGFDKEQLLHIPVNDRLLQQKIFTMKENYLALEGVEGATATGEDLPSKMNNTWGIAWEGSDPEARLGIDIVGVDQDYFALLGLGFKEGHNFLHPYEQDSSRTVIVNAQTLKMVGKASLVGEKLNIGGKDREVIAVVEDYHHSSLHHKINPVAYAIFPPGHRVSADNLFLKVQTGNLNSLLSQMEGVWQEFSPDPFVYNFVDEAFGQAYANEQQFMVLVGSFTLVGIGICLLGLFGLMSFVVKQRTKEISIRKVLGATKLHVLKVLSVDLGIVFLIALLITLPVVAYFMEDWLADYPYRIDFNYGIPMLAAFLCISISLAVVVYHLTHAFRSNPADILGTE